MTQKYKNKYRSSSTRLQSWDYGRKGIYCITICTQNKKHSFGEIINGEMQLSHIGVLADVLWHEIKNHVDNLYLHGVVVMPNHVHGIIQLLDTNNIDGDKAYLVSTVSIKKTTPVKFS